MQYSFLSFELKPQVAAKEAVEAPTKVITISS